MGHDLPMPRRLDRTTTLLAAVLLPLIISTTIGLIVLWPSGDLPSTGVVSLDAEYPEARVVEAEAVRCAGTTEVRLPSGEIPESVACVLVRAEITTTEAAGRVVEVHAPATLRLRDVPVGTRIVLTRYIATESEPELYVWYDFARTLPLGVLAIAFAVVVITVAGLRGLRALIGLILAFGVIAAFVLPALLEGQDPLAVGLVGSAAIMLVVLYMAHGFSRRTTTALLGTFAGLGITALLGVVAAETAHLSGITTEDDYRLAMLTGSLDADGLRGIFIAGVILAGLGVLNDVTITQASAVWELRASDPDAPWRTLFGRGMRIGRDHIASTVYTIAFAYAGAALPILMLLEVYRLPLLQTISTGEFAEEIARTLVGSIGLVLAIPLTTVIAAVVVTAAPHRPTAEHARPNGGHSAHGDAH